MHNAFNIQINFTHRFYSNQIFTHSDIFYYNFVFPEKKILIQIHVRRKKEEHVLFNEALNTFYLRLYGIGHMVKDHSDSERGNDAATWATLSTRVLLYASSHRQDNTYHGLCYTGWDEK